MSEFKIEVPLAITEDFGEFQCSQDIENSNTSAIVSSLDSNHKFDNNSFMDNNFTETFSGSLEDLVNTFDEKITKCFRNYDENVSNLAPVQVRSQEDVINECQYVLCLITSYDMSLHYINYYLNIIYIFIFDFIAFIYIIFIINQSNYLIFITIIAMN
jgi:hypothetical protein